MSLKSLMPVTGFQSPQRKELQMGKLQVTNVLPFEGDRDERKGTGYNQHHSVKIKTYT